MATAPPVTQRSRSARGRVATHDAESLLDLVAAVARAAVAVGKARLPERVPMAAFNVVKLDVDRARGVANPETNSERTPTADAIQMRFKELAGHPVPWAELVEIALRPPAQRTMWLSALRRDDARHDLTDALVVHAVQRVAHERGVRTLAQHEYAETQRQLVARDRARHGEDGLMEQLLPTANQILAYCDVSWQAALNLAGLEVFRQPRTAAHRNPTMNPVPGMPVPEVVALYAALNNCWPAYPGLRHFASVCNIRMKDVLPGGMGPVRSEAGRLLSAAGIKPPERTRGGGKSRRLTYRYPVNGIPGAPLRDPVRSFGGGAENPRLAELRRQLAVVSVRVWLAGLDAGDKRVRADYVRWQVGSAWTSASSLSRWGCGGFSSVKQVASDENARVRQGGGNPLADARARAEVIRAELRAATGCGAVEQPKPVPFAQALSAVLAGPHADAQPPKQ